MEPGITPRRKSTVPIAPASNRPAVIVAPGQPHALALPPEFITPQDGHTKQDCEIAAAKRWLEQNGPFYAPLKPTLLGDDLYAHQPFCRRAQIYDFHFLFVCKPDSLRKI
jgi:hypothetical protein